LSTAGAQSIDAGRASGVTGALAGELDGIAGRVQKKNKRKVNLQTQLSVCAFYK
jgi:hypothetical protein